MAGRNERREIVDQQYERNAADPNFEASSSSSNTEQRGSSCSAVDPSLNKPGYFTQEAFLDLLNQDIQECNRRLEPGDIDAEPISEGKRLILKQEISTASRLSAKYSAILSLNPSQESQAMILPSIRKFQERSAGKNSLSCLPRKRMTSLEFDQEFYSAIKDSARKAFRYSDNDQQDAALDCLDDMRYLDGYLQLRLDDSPLLHDVRYTILKHYERLIVASAEAGKMRKSEVIPEEQEAAHRLVGCTKLWDFENDFETNKKAFEKNIPSLMRTLREGQTLEDLMKGENEPVLFQKFNKTSLQLPTVLQGVRKPTVILFCDSRDSVHGSLEMELSRPHIMSVLRASSEEIYTNRIGRRAFNSGLFRVVGSISILAVAAVALAYETYLHFFHSCPK